MCMYIYIRMYIYIYTSAGIRKPNACPEPLGGPSTIRHSLPCVHWIDVQIGLQHCHIQIRKHVYLPRAGFLSPQLNHSPR